MRIAIVQPDELTSFASFLESQCEDIKSQKIRTATAFSSLGNDWRDANYHQFDKTFQEALKALDSFFQTSDEFASFLRKKAQKANDYLSRGGY